MTHEGHRRSDGHRLSDDAAGLRGDLRYFRAFVDEEKRESGVLKDYAFWRATIGVTFGFPR